MVAQAFSTQIGLRSSAEPSSTNSRAMVTAIGLVSAQSSPAWAGRREPRKVVDWLPRIDEAPLNPKTNCFTPRWHNFFRELASRVGGIQGMSIDDVSLAITQTQAQVVVAQTNAAGAVQVANASADAIAVVKQVNVDAGLSGADQIPEVSPYGVQYEVP